MHGTISEVPLSYSEQIYLFDDSEHYGRAARVFKPMLWRWRCFNVLQYAKVLSSSRVGQILSGNRKSESLDRKFAQQPSELPRTNFSNQCAASSLFPSYLFKRLVEFSKPRFIFKTSPIRFGRHGKFHLARVPGVAA